MRSLSASDAAHAADGLPHATGSGGSSSRSGGGSGRGHASTDALLAALAAAFPGLRCLGLDGAASLTCDGLAAFLSDMRELAYLQLGLTCFPTDYQRAAGCSSSLKCIEVQPAAGAQLGGGQAGAPLTLMAAPGELWPASCNAD